MAGGLDDEAVPAADVLLDLDDALAVGEELRPAAAQRDLQVIADPLGQLGIGPAGEQLELVCSLAWDMSSFSGFRSSVPRPGSDGPTMVVPSGTIAVARHAGERPDHAVGADGGIPADERERLDDRVLADR